MILNWNIFFTITENVLIKCFNVIKCFSTAHSKNAGLKTTQLELFGNPALSKYWTHAGLFYLNQLLFKDDCIAGSKWTGNHYFLLLSLFCIIKQEHMDEIQDKLNLFGWIQHCLQYYIHLNSFNKHFRYKKGTFKSIILI